MQKVRVRYAPSPTGLLHIGNARSALFNYLYAKHYDGDFIVRIEDTDIKRNVEGGEQSQLELLEWLGIDIDESPIHGGAYGPYRQLERLDLYTQYATQLVRDGMAYKEENGAIRFKVPKGKTYVFDDLVRGQLSFKSEDVEDWIMVKENGIPTYNFAVVVDDHHMEISHVFRGEEHITNTPKQLMVYEALGFDAPKFGHMTIIVNEQKKKLSKRDQNVMQFISEYKASGYLPEAMFNFIALLGWSPPIDKEILLKQQFIDYFDGTRFVKAPSMFDRDKLKFINSKYIKSLSVEALSQFIKPYLIAHHIEIKNDIWLQQLTSVFQERLHFIEEIVTLYQNFLSQSFELNEDMVSFLKEHQLQKLIETFKLEIKTIDWSPEAIQQLMKDISVSLGIKGKPLFMGLRIATTAELHGPSLPNMLALLPKETVISRLHDTLKLW
ncbi:MAG: glutamate--tRNA ligase [Acholeplasmataceae bacterium]|jgi:nondiscriminating glutamyl-tRNA synthetase